MEHFEYRMSISDAFCYEPIVEARECEAALTCDEFRDMENWAFRKPGPYPQPCNPQETVLFDSGCY